MSKKLKILLIGGGGHAKSVIDVIEQENRYEIIGIVDKKLVSVSDSLIEKIKNYFVMKFSYHYHLTPIIKDYKEDELI